VKGRSGLYFIVLIVCETIGIPIDDLRGRPAVASLGVQHVLKFCGRVDADVRDGLAELYGANDFAGYSDVVREERIAKLGRDVGINFTFVD
jgi:hypothetical protein